MRKEIIPSSAPQSKKRATLASVKTGKGKDKANLATGPVTIAVALTAITAKAACLKFRRWTHDDADDFCNHGLELILFLRIHFVPFNFHLVHKT